MKSSHGNLVKVIRGYQGRQLTNVRLKTNCMNDGYQQQLFYCVTGFAACIPHIEQLTVNTVIKILCQLCREFKSLSSESVITINTCTYIIFLTQMMEFLLIITKCETNNIQLHAGKNQTSSKLAINFVDATKTNYAYNLIQYFKKKYYFRFALIQSVVFQWPNRVEND